MRIEPPPAYKTLDFVITHLATHTLNKLAEIAGVPRGNIRAGLTGKRLFPRSHVVKLAAAAGLVLDPDGADSCHLALEGDTVLHLSVGLDELEKMRSAVTALVGQPPKWRFVLAKAEGGSYLTALVHVQGNRYSGHLQGYVAVHVDSRLLSAGLACIKEQLSVKALPDPELDVTDAQWLRLRAGLPSAAEMDAVYAMGEGPTAVARIKQQEPATAADWAKVFSLAHKMNMSPKSIMQAMQGHRGR